MSTRQRSTTRGTRTTACMPSRTARTSRSTCRRARTSSSSTTTRLTGSRKTTTPPSPPRSTNVKFFYDHKTHWITDNHNSVIAVAPGSFQSELGCPSDWDPSCLRSWLQESEGEGIYTFETTALLKGSYEAKAAINESWDENYGAGGAPNGANISFGVP